MKDTCRIAEPTFSKTTKAISWQSRPSLLSGSIFQKIPHALSSSVLYSAQRQSAQSIMKHYDRHMHRMRLSATFHERDRILDEKMFCIECV